MCGRYALYTPRSVIAEKYFGLTDNPGDQEARYNIAPGTRITLVRAGEAKDRDVEFDRSWWGFRPKWAKEDAPTPINARAEKVATSKYFAHSFRKYRGLVPANGWFEWRETAAGKVPYYITRRDDGLLWFAGIWSGMPEGEGTRCAILTAPATEKIKFVHPRMPMTLDFECARAWLDPAIRAREAIRAATKRPDPDQYIAWPVSRRVNKPENDDAELIEAVED